MIINSIRAGAFIAIACILYIIIPDKTIGALCFSIGLLSVGLTNSLLYTGQIHKIIEDNRKPIELLKIWCGNLLGVFIVFIFTKIFRPEIVDTAKTIGVNKINLGIPTLLFNSVMCGILMTIATRKTTPKYLTIGCVFAFVMCGFNHSVADTFYLLSAYNVGVKAFVSLLLISVGNFIGGLLPIIKVGQE